MRSVANCMVTEFGMRICREEEGKVVCFQHSDYEIVADIVPIERCVFKNVVGGKRCDFLFMFNREKQTYGFLKNKRSLAYYVELKGIALAEACQQLLNSIEKTKDQIKEFDINALVVSSRVFIPKYDNNENYRAVKRLIKKNIRFEISPYTENL